MSPLVHPPRPFRTCHSRTCIARRLALRFAHRPTWHSHRTHQLAHMLESQAYFSGGYGTGFVHGGLSTKSAQTDGCCHVIWHVHAAAAASPRRSTREQSVRARKRSELTDCAPCDERLRSSSIVLLLLLLGFGTGRQGAPVRASLTRC